MPELCITEKHVLWTSEIGRFLKGIRILCRRDHFKRWFETDLSFEPPTFLLQIEPTNKVLSGLYMTGLRRFPPFTPSCTHVFLVDSRLLLLGELPKGRTRNQEHRIKRSVQCPIPSFYLQSKLEIMWHNKIITFINYIYHLDQFCYVSCAQ